MASTCRQTVGFLGYFTEMSFVRLSTSSPTRLWSMSVETNIIFKLAVSSGPVTSRGLTSTRTTCGETQPRWSKLQRWQVDSLLSIANTSSILALTMSKWKFGAVKILKCPFVSGNVAGSCIFLLVRELVGRQGELSLGVSFEYWLLTGHIFRDYHPYSFLGKDSHGVNTLRTVMVSEKGVFFGYLI